MPKLSLPMQLLLLILFVLCFGTMLPPQLVQLLYSISLTLKEFLSFLLPFMVFAFISTGILAFKKQAPLVIAILLACIMLSNSLTAFFAYLISTNLLTYITNGVVLDTLDTQQILHPFWTFHLPKPVSSEHAMLLAVIIGLLLSYLAMPKVETALGKLKKTIEFLINRLFIPLLPLYIIGFLLELQHKGIFAQLFQSYGKTFALIFVLHMCMIFIIYFIASSLHLQTALRYIHNAIPSYLTAFGTMSSAATIPVTMQCAQKNIGDAPLIAMATPIAANVHLLGDAISTPILTLTTLYLFTGSIPTPAVFTTFIVYFCLNMLAVSAVPGGGIIIMIPLLTTIFGFSDAMISIITTLYFLQDSIGTAANVMGDGAMIIIVHKLLKKLGISA